LIDDEPPTTRPRGQIISAVYLALYDWPPPKPKAADDAATAQWVPVAEARPLAFDHAQVLADALALARRTAT
jgi:8-oxo-dGTP diphosphatase